MNNWHLLTTFSNISEANILKGWLAQNQVPVLLLNKQDSSYLIGEIELYVPIYLKDLALSLWQQSLQN